MIITIIKFHRFDIDHIPDKIPGKRYHGILGYNSFLGWILKIFSLAISIKDVHNKTFYLNRKSTIHWLQRHGQNLSISTHPSKVVKCLQDALPAPFKTLPNDMINHIASFITNWDKKNLKLISKQFYEARSVQWFSGNKIADRLHKVIKWSKLFCITGRFNSEIQVLSYYEKYRDEFGRINRVYVPRNPKQIYGDHYPLKIGSHEHILNFLKRVDDKEQLSIELFDNLSIAQKKSLLMDLLEFKNIYIQSLQNLPKKDRKIYASNLDLYSKVESLIQNLRP